MPTTEFTQTLEILESLFSDTDTRGTDPILTKKLRNKLGAHRGACSALQNSEESVLLELEAASKLITETHARMQRVQGRLARIHTTQALWVAAFVQESENIVAEHNGATTT
jgi:hypothetical protein